MANPIELSEERVDFFCSRIEVMPSGCHEWRGKRRPNGYGLYREHYAHRIAYTLANGPIPGELFVCHACDNKICVNPDHLWLGTNADNQRDLTEKGLRPKLFKTHCKRGHPLSGDNLYIIPKMGQRACRACRKVHKDKWNARNGRSFILAKQEWR